MFLKISLAAHAALILLFLGVPWLSVLVVAAYGAYHVALAWAILHPRSTLFGPNLSRLATDDRLYALTFDDGPHPTITPRVLDVLRERGVHATFFVIGRWVEQHPGIVQRIVREGHQVGNHTETHPYNFWLLPPGRVSREVSLASRAIEKESGQRCRFFRAPVGMKGCFLHRVLRRSGLGLVSWEVRFVDRSADRLRIRKQLANRIRPGSVVLLHDGHDRDPRGNPAVLEALPLVLDTLSELGYRDAPLAFGSGDGSVGRLPS